MSSKSVGRDRAAAGTASSAATVRDADAAITGAVDSTSRHRRVITGWSCSAAAIDAVSASSSTHRNGCDMTRATSFVRRGPV
eukprot:3247879-Prymnesium_polylepis.1